MLLITRNSAPRAWLTAAFASALLLGTGTASAERSANISNTKHNLSVGSGNAVSAKAEASGGTSEICVFCHTPHGGDTSQPIPLWNRQLSSATYTPYGSNTLDATDLGQPGGKSKLCLSCHDGTLAIGAVSNAPGAGAGSAIATQYDSGGSAETISTLSDLSTHSVNPIDNQSGFTRALGTDLTNDHPISFTYNTALSTSDGELRDPSSVSHIDVASPGNRPTYPLDSNSKLQCTSCHDPHVEGVDAPAGTTAPTANNSKFLRGPRFQMDTPDGAFSEGTFNAAGDATAGDIVCLACHNKDLNTSAWANSVHANPSVGDEVYADTPADKREFPRGIKVWQAACLNCHDTHTVQGSRRLLREGTDATPASAGALRSGGNPAIEETCFQCHSNSGDVRQVLVDPSAVPNIKDEFARTYHMPITTADQLTTGTAEIHDIQDADFTEDPTLLGSLNNSNRHAECTDCHNPHRIVRNSRFNQDGLGNSAQRVHDAGKNETSGGNNDGREGNVASGVLRGAWGINPTVTSITANWPELAINIDYTGTGDVNIKRGDPSAAGAYKDSVSVDAPHLTREYQLCFKCHSGYGANVGNMPSLGGHGGATPLSTNGMAQYTNVAAEFLSVNATSPATSGTDQGEEGNSGSACAATATTGTEATGGDCNPTPSDPGGTNNHRSWHPVVYPTGRDKVERGSTSFANIRAPFNDNVGTQTMHCSDCHGSEVSWTQGTGPDLTSVQGPHGSGQKFLLKGKWDTTINPGNVSGTNSSGSLCGRCHQPTSTSGFAGATEASHSFTPKRNRYCMACHIAVPHGWKNKAFLVNLQCVGTEGGQAAGCTAVGGATSTQTIAPYYNQALLRINNWQRSGNWPETSCGTSSNNGKDWMSSACGF